MGRINVPRVIAGGLVAGLICNLSGMALGGMVLQADFQRVLDAMDSPPSMMQLFVTHVLMRFALGLLAVWLYAAIRPRFGPGPKTACLAGVFIWIAAYVLAGLMLQEVQIYSMQTLLISLAWGFVEAVLMTLAGAAVYREAR